MNLKNQRRMATQIMKCGSGRVWMNPDNEEEIKPAITKDDVRSLIGRGIIRLKHEKGVSRGRAREVAKQKRKGLRKGIGSRKGKASSRLNPKCVWIARIRSLRRLFSLLREKGAITNDTYRMLREKSKGGFFRSGKHALLYLEEHNLLKRKYEKK